MSDAGGAGEPLPQRPARARRPVSVAAVPSAEAAKRNRDEAAGVDARAAERDDAAAPAGVDDGTVTVAWREGDGAAQSFEWGRTVEEAFGWTALAMFNYMARTPLSGFAGAPLDVHHELQLTEAHDMDTLLFHFLDELLFLFCTEMFVVRELVLGQLDRAAWTVSVTARGSTFVPGTHEQGTEVKAITYSAMSVTERPEAEAVDAQHAAEIFCIVDI